MTLLEAFKAGCEFGYVNDDLLEKILIDRDLTATDSYTKDYRDDIDLCLIDLYTHLKTHPEIRDGNSHIKYDAISLDKAILNLANRYNLSTTTRIGIGLRPNVSGKARW